MANETLRRSDAVEITQQKAKGKFWYNLKKLFLRILGFVLIVGGIGIKNQEK